MILHQTKATTFGKVDLLDTSCSFIPLDEFNALSSLCDELWDQVMRVHDGSFENPRWGYRRGMLICEVVAPIIPMEFCIKTTWRIVGNFNMNTLFA